ncbi:MAG: mannonate dehydratase [Christensenellaceae bacterium]|jgi:mannonate dehydratase|nr:mannonate dehydratase [Christensenellaceae bacterium]
MKIGFRWYGFKDSITLTQIRQIPVVSTIVSAVYSSPPGSVWGEDEISSMVSTCNSHGLNFDVVESVPVHEDIKLGRETKKIHIENYKKNIRLLARHGIKCICYNFMPVFDWLRSELSVVNKDGSNSLAYVHENVLSLNPLTSSLSLPGWDESYTKKELKELLNAYKDVTQEKLWDNLSYFLTEIIPVAIECSINMAIHTDDPPWSMFGLPRIITSVESVKRLASIVAHPANGITFCSGSFGAEQSNNLVEIIKAGATRTHFSHLRNIKCSNSKDFIETAHPSMCGDLDMYLLLKTLLDNGFDGYVRPDHGRMIWGETGRPGYGLYDRALGATYIAGLYEAITKSRVI